MRKAGFLSTFQKLKTSLVAGSILALPLAAHSTGQQTDEIFYTEYVDSLARMDPTHWIDEANEGHPAPEFYAAADVLPISESEIHQQTKLTGKIAPGPATQMFQMSGEYAARIGSSGVAVETLDQVPGGRALDAVLLPGPLDPGPAIAFLSRGMVLGRSQFHHQYGASMGIGTIGGTPAVWHDTTTGTGSGIWEFEWRIYALVGEQVRPVGWIPKEINQTAWFGLERHLTTAIIKQSPLTVRFDWEVRMPETNPEAAPTLGGSAVVAYELNTDRTSLVANFQSGILNDEKLLALSLSGPDELFIHAFAAELKQKLSKGGPECDAVISWLRAVRDRND
jgi:hypothetical protein